MKRIAFLLITIFLLSSCNMQSEAQTTKNIVEEFGFVDMLADEIADINSMEAITEISSQIILCEVKDRTEMIWTETNMFNFTYEVEVIEVYLDTHDNLEPGDIITVSSSEGLVPAKEAAEIVSETPRAQKLGILQGEYNDNDYIRCSAWDAIPIEVGKTYLMYLDDCYLEREGKYAESGRTYLFEYADNAVYQKRNMEDTGLSFHEILTQVKDHIDKRTGRADEIGYYPYLEELGRQQAASADLE